MGDDPPRVVMDSVVVVQHSVSGFSVEWDKSPYSG